MVIGVCRLRVLLHDVFSLKHKRGIIKRIIGRVQSRFHVSIAEVADNDRMCSSVIGFCVVGNDRRFVNSVVDKIANFVESLYLGEIIERSIEIINV